MQGRRIDCSLNETGLLQARALAERLAAVPFDAIYSSSLTRAIQTADIVAEHHAGVPRRRFSGLDEMSWGVFEGESRSDRLTQMLDDMYDHWERGAFEFKVEQGESVYDVQARCVTAVQDILAAQAGKTVLVVSHGRLLRILLASILGLGLAKMDEFDHANTCVNVIKHREGSFTPALLNCTAHLDRVDSVLIE